MKTFTLGRIIPLVEVSAADPFEHDLLRSDCAANELPLRDARHRPLRDLRISVTDRCNFRCVYCMPKEVFGKDYAFLPRLELLSFEEIERAARVFVGLGVEKIRLTGGEPLLRKDLEYLVERLARLRTPCGADIDLTLTTNGSLLSRKAQSLRNAGMKRITVSLDSIDETVFQRMNGVGFPAALVLEGIDAALRVGFAPVKVNMGNGWNVESVVPSSEVVRCIDSVFPLVPTGRDKSSDTSMRFHYADGQGEIGVISSVTQPFCGDCSRLRLSADGRLYTCLFAAHGFDIRSLVRDECTDETLRRLVAELWMRRVDRYSEQRGENSAAHDQSKVEMSFIGG